MRKLAAAVLAVLPLSLSLVRAEDAPVPKGAPAEVKEAPPARAPSKQASSKANAKAKAGARKAKAAEAEAKAPATGQGPAAGEKKEPDAKPPPCEELKPCPVD